MASTNWHTQHGTKQRQAISDVNSRNKTFPSMEKNQKTKKKKPEQSRKSTGKKNLKIKKTTKKQQTTLCNMFLPATDQ